MIDLFDTNKDYYAVLGLSRECDGSEIKMAFRKLARRYHPDVNGHPLATSRFQEVSEAYEVLSRHKSAYDSAIDALRQAAASSYQARQQRSSFQSNDQSRERGRTSTWQGSSGFGGQDDSHRLSSSLDRVVVYPLTLKYAFKVIEQGYYHIPSLNTKIAFNSEFINGKQARFKGKGFPGRNGEPAGDYIVSFKITHHSPYKIEGNDLYMQLKINRRVWENGGTVYFDAPSGFFKVNVPKGIKLGSMLKFRQKGFPAGRFRLSGDLYAKIILDKES
jgi:curved DNA-binding protein